MSTETKRKRTWHVKATRPQHKSFIEEQRRTVVENASYTKGCAKDHELGPRTPAPLTASRGKTSERTNQRGTVRTNERSDTHSSANQPALRLSDAAQSADLLYPEPVGLSIGALLQQRAGPKGGTAHKLRLLSGGGVFCVCGGWTAACLPACLLTRLPVCLPGWLHGFAGRVANRRGRWTGWQTGSQPGRMLVCPSARVDKRTNGRTLASYKEKTTTGTTAASTTTRTHTLRLQQQRRRRRRGPTSISKASKHSARRPSLMNKRTKKN